MNLGNTIKQLRKMKGIKQLTLAQSCTITQSYLSNIEANRKEATLGTLEKIAKELSIPLPIVFFLAMDENDIQEEKQDYFKIIAPQMKEVLLSAFS